MVRRPHGWLALVVLAGCGGTAPSSARPDDTTQPASAEQAATSGQEQPGGAFGSEPSLEEVHRHVRWHGRRHSFDDPARWARRWDTPQRDRWQQPERILQLLDLKDGMRVADLGAGTGYFTVRLARALPAGTVYAVDLEPSMLEWIAQRADREGLDNVRTVHATPDDPKLPEPVDLVFVVNTWHHVEGRVDYLKRLLARLRPGGRVAVLDYRPDWDGPGPPKRIRLTLEAVRGELEAAGYRVVLAEPRATDRQYLIVAERP